MPQQNLSGAVSKAHSKSTKHPAKKFKSKHNIDAYASRRETAEDISTGQRKNRGDSGEKWPIILLNGSQVGKHLVGSE
ncbi:hypothetical protein HYFRA_00009681 [Hymenoscyphus fraxineus]|uniref:Uncharacterized protein n=1 Tax=Hymenoscyphus fraxineus TaxID=746836 RepID=A0A9N9KUW5_9HELO|nr:hypothetical protein HYFRA_00009681 [Hymenoscyphus fraxineus]